MGTARATPTIPLRNNPNFTSAPRLDIPFSVLIDILHWPDLSRQLDTAGLRTLAVDSRAMPRRQKYLAATWAAPPGRRASPVHLIRAVLQSRWCEVVGHSSEQGTSHLQSNWPCFRRDRLLHDRRSSRYDMHRRHAANRREPARHKAVGFDHPTHQVSSGIGF